jgi:hypothetical protein
MNQRSFIFVLTRYANLVFDTSCILLYLSKALYSLSEKNLIYKIYFWVHWFKAWIFWLKTKKLVIPFLRFYLYASLFYLCIVSSHIRNFANLTGYPPRNPKYLFVYTFLTITQNFEYGWIFRRRLQDVIKWNKILRDLHKRIPRRFQVSLFKKIQEFQHLPRHNNHLFARGWPKSKHGGLPRKYYCSLEFKGSKKIRRRRK